MSLRFYKITLLFFISLMGYGQSFKVPDSLRKKTYKELEIAFNDNLNDSLLSNLYARIYLEKAKNKNDSIKMADGYYFISKICPGSFEIKYLDSLILVSKNVKNIKYPGVGYLNKGVCFYDQEDYNEALENYLIAQEYANENNNVHHQIAIKHNIGLLKKTIDATAEALLVFKQNLDFIKTQDTINKYSRSYITTLFAIADSYHRMNFPDSASYYVNKALYKSFKRRDKYKYADLLLLQGINNYMLKDYQKSLDTLYKASQQIQNTERYNSNEAYCYIQIARALQKLKENDKAIYYLKKADAIITTDNYTDEKRIAYEILIDHYKDLDDIQNQLKMMNKLIALDSTYYTRNKSVKSNIVTKYDTVLLINERNAIINKLEKKNTAISSQNIIISILLAISLFGVGYYYYRQRLYKKRFLKLLDTTADQSKKKDSSNNDSSGSSINKETLKNLLDQLQKFEEKQGYLKSNLNAKDLAKSFGSNSSYLSKVVNTFKEKSFSSYINDLRINFVIDKLREDSIFRKYTVKAIAQEIGFNNAEAFSKAFYKKTGIYPSYFIKKLEKQQSV